MKSLRSFRDFLKQSASASLLGFAVAFLALPTHPSSHAADPTALGLQQRGFFRDREYFMVRSGRAQWIIQTDRADLGPAVTGYLFDADYIPYNHKHQAYSSTDAEGARRSALEVIPQKSGHAFQAYGEHTLARWVERDGVPTVEATWWADGVRVKELFSGMAENNSIRRVITLTGANHHGDEQYTLRLRVPAGNATATNRALFVTHKACPQAVVVTGDQPVKADAANGWLEIGPLTLSPDKTVTVETFVLAQIPANTQTAEDFQKQIARASGRAGELVHATRDWWSRAARLQTDDALVREVFDNTRSVMPALVSDAGVFRVGPFMYGTEWVRDNSQFTLGLTSSGQFELARAALEHILRDMITKDGTTMIGGDFANPDAEQFDQTGELLLSLRWYVELSGDSSLVSTYREKLLALAERPLKFRDSTGLVHNRREFWEQSMNDAYELSYNCYVIVGLREAAALAKPLGAEDRKDGWLKEADAMQAAMLKVLVHDGTFIKRRDVTGEIAEHLVNVDVLRLKEVPSVNVNHHRIHPDATMALPMALGLVAPQSALASNTLNQLEKLRDLRWSGGGYDRYDSTSEINTPGPWGIAGALILRGQHAAGQFDRSRRTLEWFRTVTGGNAGLYYEEIPLVVGYPQDAVGLVAWPSGELPYFVVRYYLGLTFANDGVVIRPQLYHNSPPVRANLRFRKGRLNLEIPGPGPFASADVNGQRVAVDRDGAVRLPADFAGGTVVFHREPTDGVKTYGLLESGLPGLTEAVKRSQTGVTKCTISSTTHGADVHCRWGEQSWSNDLYFGLHGGLYGGDVWQANVFCDELEKISRFVGVAPGKACAPFTVNKDGTGAMWNDDSGIDFDRCAEFVLNTVRVYEFTGDRRFGESMYGKCRQVIEYLRRWDVDHDLLPEGRTLNGPVTGVGSCASVSYIGDTVKNDHKDFGASLFFYDALVHLAKLEEILGKPAEAATHRQEAVALKAAINKVFWNKAGNGYLAWIERNGAQHDDWITGNNLHAIACGLTDAQQASAIVGYLDKNRAAIEDLVPCRVRIGAYAKGLCRDADNDYWNGGCWPLVSAPDMMARRVTGDLSAAVRVADTLANKVKTTANGFYEMYNGVTGAPNAAYSEGLLMNNGGFLWGVYAGLFGIDVDGDSLVLSGNLSMEVLPAVMRMRYRNADLVIRWQGGDHARLTVDGNEAQSEDGQYRLNLKPVPDQEISITMSVNHE